MMGCPVRNYEASHCLALWGWGEGYGGPRAFPDTSSFVPRARGISAEWHDDRVDVVGLVYHKYFSDVMREVVGMHYKPCADPRRNGELVSCNITFLILRMEAKRRENENAFNDELFNLKGKVNTTRLHELLNIAIGMVAMALSSPSISSELNENAEI